MPPAVYCTTPLRAHFQSIVPVLVRFLLGEEASIQAHAGGSKLGG